MRRLIAVATVVAGAALAVAGPAQAAPTWAPAASAPVHPGVQTITNGGQCTSNFVFFDAANNVYIGQAAHGAGTDGNTATTGCDAGSLPTGTPVEVDGASQPGTMVYSSWVTMQANGESDADTCQYNDLALVKLDPADYGKVNPSIPFWGGPTGLTDTVAQGDKVLSYGNSSLRLGITQLSPKEGVSLGQDAGGWNHTVYTVTPGIPGDSGSAFIDRQGRAFGVLSTLQVAPVAGGNGVGDLSRELAYMESHGGPDVTLAQGTEAFRGPLLP
ncbi:MAG TPA: serine protease [Solirubrobacteraceae bacterium]|nr:serine protease [Solirubrobacteraceae bacterium]